MMVNTDKAAGYRGARYGGEKSQMIGDMCRYESDVKKGDELNLLRADWSKESVDGVFQGRGIDW